MQGPPTSLPPVLPVQTGPTLRVTTLEPGASLALVGRLAATTVADARAALAVAIDTGAGDLVVDLSGVELLDATGLGVLVGAHRRAMQSGRRLVLREVPERIERLLGATRLHRILVIERPVAV